MSTNDELSRMVGSEGLRPISARSLRTGLVVDAIRNAILQGLFAPGEQLVERELASKLAVSTTPVREALRTLQASGLLESKPSGGVVVRRVDAKMVEHLYEFRLLLEPDAVRLSVPYLDDGLLEQAESALDQGRRLGDDGEISGLSRVNRNFHKLLYERCPNELLKSALDGLSDQLAFVAAAGWRIQRTWNTERQEHIEIFDAVAAGDAARAKELSYAHIEHAWNQLIATTSANEPPAR